MNDQQTLSAERGADSGAAPCSANHPTCKYCIYSKMAHPAGSWCYMFKRGNHVMRFDNKGWCAKYEGICQGCGMKLSIVVDDLCATCSGRLARSNSPNDQALRPARSNEKDAMYTETQRSASLAAAQGSARGPIWRTVVTQTVRDNPGHEKSWAVGGSRTLQLNCGHDSPRKQSVAVPKRVRCKTCESRRNGSVETRTHLDGSETVETWDAETQMPKRVTSVPNTQALARRD